MNSKEEQRLNQKLIGLFRRSISATKILYASTNHSAKGNDGGGAYAYFEISVPRDLAIKGMKISREIERLSYGCFAGLSRYERDTIDCFWTSHGFDLVEGSSLANNPQIRECLDRMNADLEECSIEELYCDVLEENERETIVGFGERVDVLWDC